MTAIQIILILGGLVLFVMIVRSRSLILHRMAGLVLFVAILVATLLPDLTTRVAQLLGVGRGADLILYGSFLLFSYVSMLLLGKIRKLLRDITLLTRALAHHEAKPPAQPPDH
jgi:hypothetical protein